MSKLHVPKDLLDNYAWMKRKVLGLEDQSIRTTNRPAYGNHEVISLAVGRGWETGFAGTPTMPKPVLETVADQTFITGAVKWIRDKDVRAVILPPGTAPLEEYTFLTIRASDKKFIRIRVTTDGFVRIPTGDHSIYHLSLRYPTPRGGE